MIPEMSRMDETVVSCPGKVLIAGGYLVLDRAYTGMVVGTCSRFYTSIRAASADLARQPGTQIVLVVKSPQFLEAEWTFLVKRTESQETDVVLEHVANQSGSSSQNKFVELAVRESLRLSIALRDDECMFARSAESAPNGPREPPYKVIATILGDNDFYSQPRQDSTPPVPFNPLRTTLGAVHKTGLGSSAAMVTSLCSAILLHFTPSLDIRTSGTKSILHNLSQYVHSLAQGKVGSGFDVSAAVWGTHAYRRFSPSCLDGLLELEESQISPSTLRNVLDPTLNSAWTDLSTAPEVKHFSIPSYTTLLLADVDAGSHTPSMVGKVLRWRTDQKELASKLWDQISGANIRIREAFDRLEKLSNQDQPGYLSQLTQLAQDARSLVQNDANSKGDDIVSLFRKASSAMKETRKLMKDMGDRSDVPIEPDSQTKLLDQCERLPGVIGSGVPGAGGYDAIWVLVFSPPGSQTTVIDKVLELWKNWSQVSVKSLSPASWVVGGGERSYDDGLRVLRPNDQVDGLKDNLSSYQVTTT